MSEPRSIESHLRSLENVLDEMTWVQGKARRDALEETARRAVEDIHSRLVAGQIPGREKTRTKGDEFVGYMKTCLNAKSDRETVRKYQSLARRSLKSFVDYLEETSAITEPFKFR